MRFSLLPSCLTLCLLGASHSTSGCKEAAQETVASAEELMDPENCKTCHPDHYDEWLGSMHAYAAEDPLFRAMNARGQRETNGTLGDFCVRCHAPMAVALGLTKDGLNLDQIPQAYQGVTCYFCHNVSSVEGTHNNPLQLAMDSTMRGPINDPSDSGFHRSSYSTLQDGRSLDSGDMCGSCHDIVTPKGVELERSYREWLDSFYSDPDPDFPKNPAFYAQSCNNCHMPGETGIVADVPGVSADRRRHSHLFPGVDVAISDFPNSEIAADLRTTQEEAMADIRRTLLCSNICVQDGNEGEANIQVWLHNESAGHGWPSGANQDRRAWVEVIAYAGDEILLHSGNVEEGQAVTSLDDPNLWLFRDAIFNEDGEEVHMFWEAASYESSQLKVPSEVSADASTWVARDYALELPSGQLIDRVEVKVHIRPVALEVVDSLINSGDLDAGFRPRFKTYPVMALDWQVDEAYNLDEAGKCVGSSLSCWAPDLPSP